MFSLHQCEREYGKIQSLMNAKFKSLLYLFAIGYSLLFSSCEKDLYDEALSTPYAATSQKISVEQLLREISNPELKDYIKNELPHQIGFSTERITGQQYLEFFKILKRNSYITYSFLTNIYTDDKQYTQYFIITKDGSTEKAGYARYIPDSPITEFNVLDFTGKVQILDIHQNVAAETRYVNGVAQPPSQNNLGITCVHTVNIYTYYCSQPGHHEPGDPECIPGDAYYEVVVTTVCTGQMVEYIAAPSSFMGQGGGGGITWNQDVMVFLNLLNNDNPNAFDILVSHPELITYLEQNYASQESKDFVMDIVHALQYDNAGILNPDEFDDQITTSLPPCLENVVNDLKTLQNGKFGQVISTFAGNNPLALNFNWHVTTAPLSTSPVVAAETSFSMGIASTELNNNYINVSTDLSLAKTLIHECFHAYLSSVYRYQNNIDKNYINLINTYAAQFNNNLNDIHHYVYSITNIISQISLALKEYGVSKGYNLPQQFYDDMAWGGLAGTQAFNALPQSDRDRILDTIDAEFSNSNSNPSQISPKGVQICP